MGIRTGLRSLDDSVRRVIPAKENPPKFLKVRSSSLFISIAVCIAVFSDVFLYGVVVPVIPFAIRVRAGVAAEDVQHWVSILLAVYGAALLVAAPICGIVADRTSSRRGPLLFGLLVLAGATVMLCIGRSIGVLLAGRILQGASAGLVWTVALALLSDTVGKEQSGQALGYVATSYSVGVLVAPLLGGVVYDESGYYAVFAMAFGVIAVDIILRLLIVEKKIAAKWVQPESQTPVEITNEDEIELEDMETSFANSAEAEKAASKTTIEVQTETSKKKLPAILILLQSSRILAAFWGNFIAAASMGALDSTLPLFVNKTFGWNSLGAGLIFIAPVVPTFFGPVIGYLTDRYGPKWIATIGLVLSLPFWVLLRLVDHNDIKQKVLLCALLFLLGLALGLTLTSLMSEFSKVCDAKEKQDPNLFGNRSAYAQSYGIFNMAWAAGMLVGPLWAGNLRKDVGWKTMTWTFGLVSGVSAIPIALYSGGFIVRRKAKASPSREG